MLKKHERALQTMRTAQQDEGYIRNSIERMTPGLSPPRLGQVKVQIISAEVIPEMYQKIIISDVTPAKSVEEAAARIREFVEKQKSA